MTNEEFTMWVLLKKYILTKNSHGKNELLKAMVDIEMETVLPKSRLPDPNTQMLTSISWPIDRHLV